METDIIKRLLLVIAITAAVVSVSYRIGRRDGQISFVGGESIKVDTLLIFDTIAQYKPIFEERVVLEKVPYPVTDTLWMHDTLFVYLEREQVVWQDSLSRVYASGIFPQIDRVQHFIEEKVVTIQIPVKKPCKWGIGIQAGYGIQFGQEMKMSPYIGLGVIYNIFSW